MKFALWLRLSRAGIVLVAAFLLTGHAYSQEIWYDDDTDLTFVWTPPEGSFEHYNVYVSVDGGEYYLAGQTATERFVVNGTNGCTHRVKVAAVSGGFEGPFSPESDPVVCDTVAPLAPTISATYMVLDEATVVVKLQSAPTDINFACYQALGGQFTDWTDTEETQSFTFTVNAESQNVLAIREKDLAGNVGPEASLTVEDLSGDSDGDGIPNYWELMYCEVLSPKDPGDASFDSDGDGYTNYEEYLAGTDPTRADSSPPDTNPPFTFGHSPAKGATEVPTDAAVSLHVADTGHGVQISSIVMTVNGAAGTAAPQVMITGTGRDYCVFYTPPTPFGYGQSVTVTVDAHDLYSPANVMPTETYTFRTVPRPDNEPPQTSDHFPAKGATDVLPEAPITLHITDSGKGVDKASIAMTVNGQPVAPTITGTAADYLVTYVPSLRFDYEETVAVTVDAKDLNSPANVMPTDSYSFTVMPSPDTTPPRTTAHSPQRGATDVAANTTISLHITDEGDGVDFSSIAMTVNGSPVVPSVTGTLAECLVVYDPPVNFAYGETVTVTVDARDLHSPANVMNQDRYEFTIAASPDNDPAASDPDVFFFENFEDGDVHFPKWDNADNANELATGDLAIVAGNIPISNGSKVLRLGATRSFGAGLVKHFAPTDTVYIRWYARFASGLSQRDLLQFVTIAADSTGELYRVGDVCPNGYDYFRTSLDFTTAFGRHSPPGKALLYTYSAGMIPKFYDADGDGHKELNWPGNGFYPIPSLLIEDDGWHCLEMMLRVNTPGLADGEQAFWIDGKLAGYWSGVNWRLTDALKVNCLWLRFALPQVSLTNQVWIDNVALSTKYIGAIDGSRDETPVEIDELSIDAVGHTSATITWTTNKPATSIALYGAGEGFGNVTVDTSLRTEHLMTLKRLKSGKEYVCRVVSRDATGANGATSQGLRFTTQTTTKGIFTEVWGDAAESNHPGTVQNTYISVVNVSPDGDKEAPLAPASSPTLCAYTFPTGKPAAALLMKWDLSAIPPTAEILEAKLCLYMCEAAGDADYSMSVHEVVGVDPVIAEATGQEYRTASSWDPFSGLYNDVPLAQGNIAYPEAVVNVSDTIGEYKEWTLTEMVSRWVLSPSRNHGLLINPDPNASEGSYRYFRSSSYADPSQRPRLIVTCRTDRGQKLYWEDGAFVIWTDPLVSEQYVVQSAGSPGAVWTAETSLLSAPWWQSGDVGNTRIRFFRIEAKP